MNSNNSVLDYFLEFSNEFVAASVINFDKLGLLNPLTFRIEKQETL